VSLTGTLTLDGIEALVFIEEIQEAKEGIQHDIFSKYLENDMHRSIKTEPTQS
jgi:hypothetical protein